MIVRGALPPGPPYTLARGGPFRPRSARVARSRLLARTAGASNTERLRRLNLEATSPEKREAKRDEVLAFIRS
jgi:hypothetical protein